MSIPRLTQTPASDIPSPLRIVKRTKTLEFHPSTKRGTSNGSIDYGPDRPLSVMKKRQCRDPTDISTISEDSVTPKAGKIPPARRSSKSRIRHTSSPRSLSGLRWFSNRKTSSLNTARRQYDLQNYSTSSDSSSIVRSADTGLFKQLPFLDAFDSRTPSLADTSSSSLSISDRYSSDNHLLVPRLSVTSEVQTFSEGISTVWATIELSAHLSIPWIDNAPHSRADDRLLQSNPLRVGSVSRFGYLYNLQIKVLPASESTITDVIHYDGKRCLSLGSSLLVLAKVHVDTRRLWQADAPKAKKSKELMVDLERQLESANVEYLRVRLRYRHSGFSGPSNFALVDGIKGFQTQLETTATLAIEQQVLNPPWSLPRANTSQSLLFGIVASHWGPLRANEVLHQETFHQTSSRATADVSYISIDGNKVPQHGLTPNSRGELCASAHVPQGPDSQRLSPDQEEDPARKIWTEMRRKSSRNRPALRTSKADGLPKVLTISQKASNSAGSINSKSDVERRREVIRDIALRNKRSIGADSLKSLVPSMMGLDIGGKENSEDSSDFSNKENVPPERRREGRWSIGGWWRD
ncbi:hypothetical protein F5Y19DRAFT_462383 [Xylariaceae sp. FL1651]|nr:hypothetical protein F5Y19DRAFT_462383 [Xylariaceae sp. FL1651]